MDPITTALLCALGIGAVVAWVVGRVVANRPTREFVWRTEPRLRIGADVPKGIRTAATVAWGDLQRLRGKSHACMVGGPRMPQPGEIYVQMAPKWATKQHAGEVHVFLDEEGAPVFAEIRLPPGSTRLVALHEILRAYGFHALQVSGHVLTHDTRKLGSSTHGIREEFERRRR